MIEKMRIEFQTKISPGYDAIDHNMKTVLAKMIPLED